MDGHTERPTLETGMKKTTTTLMLAGALAAAPLALAAQTPEAPAHRGPHAGMMHRGPGHGPGLGALLRNRAELELTAEQVARLEAIQRDLHARNEPLRQQMAALMPEHARRMQRMEPGERPRMTDEQRRQMREQRSERMQQHRRMTDEQRQQMRARMEQARPVMEQMRANAQAAMEQARAVLTEEQRAKARESIREHRTEARERMREHRRENGRRGRTEQRTPRSR
jgi:protein CpxP